MNSIQQRRGKDLSSEARYDHVFAVAYGSFFTSFGTEQSDLWCMLPLPFSFFSYKPERLVERNRERNRKKEKRQVETKRKRKNPLPTRPLCVGPFCKENQTVSLVLWRWARCTENFKIENIFFFEIHDHPDTFPLKSMSPRHSLVR